MPNIIKVALAKKTKHLKETTIKQRRDVQARNRLCLSKARERTV